MKFKHQKSELFNLGRRNPRNIIIARTVDMVWVKKIPRLQKWAFYEKQLFQVFSYCDLVVYLVNKIWMYTWMNNLFIYTLHSQVRHSKNEIQWNLIKNKLLVQIVDMAKQDRTIDHRPDMQFIFHFHILFRIN